MILLDRMRWRRAPSGPVVVDGRSPFAEGLVFWAPLNTPDPRDVVQGTPPTTATATFGAKASEVGWLFTGIAGSRLLWSSFPWMPYPLTLAAEHSPMPDTGGGVIFHVSSQEASGFQWYVDAITSPGYATRARSGAATPVGAISSWTLGSVSALRMLHATGTFTSQANRTAYTSGQWGVTDTTNRTPGTIPALGCIVGGQRYAGGDGTPYTGLVRNAAAWNRLLNASEIASLGAEPWQFAASPTARSYFFLGATAAALRARTGPSFCTAPSPRLTLEV